MLLNIFRVTHGFGVPMWVLANHDRKKCSLMELWWKETWTTTLQWNESILTKQISPQFGDEMVKMAPYYSTLTTRLTSQKKPVNNRLRFDAKGSRQVKRTASSEDVESASWNMQVSNLWVRWRTHLSVGLSRWAALGVWHTCCSCMFLSACDDIETSQEYTVQDIFKYGFAEGYKLNQSRICGKGVGLSLFPSDSLSFESYEQFVRKSKKPKNDFFWPFLG